MNEPWETTTKYGRADLTIHPIMREVYKVACLIERCGASVELTAASSAAFALCEQLFDLLMSLSSEGIMQQQEIKRLRKQRDELFEALKPFANWRLPYAQNELHRIHQRVRAAVVKVFDLGVVKVGDKQLVCSRIRCVAQDPVPDTGFVLVWHEAQRTNELLPIAWDAKEYHETNAHCGIYGPAWYWMQLVQPSLGASTDG